jgi:hypothetical protein
MSLSFDEMAKSFNLKNSPTSTPSRVAIPTRPLLQTPPTTPISSKQRASVHHKGRKRSIIDLVIHDNKNSASSVSPLSSPSPSPASSFSFNSSTQNKSFSFFHSPSSLPNKLTPLSSSSKQPPLPPNFECADFMDAPKVNSKITGGKLAIRLSIDHLPLTSSLSQIGSTQER